MCIKCNASAAIIQSTCTAVMLLSPETSENTQSQHRKPHIRKPAIRRQAESYRNIRNSEVVLLKWAMLNKKEIQPGPASLFLTTLGVRNFETGIIVLRFLGGWLYSYYKSSAKRLDTITATQAQQAVAL